MTKKILIAEDAVDLANAVVKHLESEGFDVDHALNGSEALDLLYSQKYDLLLLDLNMPKLNGFDVASALKELDHKIFIIAVTARDGLDDKLKGFDLGFDDYVTKPFDMRELTARVNAVLRREKEDMHKTFCVEDLKIDLSTRTVFQKDEELSLTKIEFDLLSLLVNKAPAVVENYEIIEALWGDEEMFDPPIRSHIKNLRRKIGDDNFELIITVAGVGYKMKEVEEC